MDLNDSSELTALLIKWSDGDESALEQLIPYVERELRQIAHAHMRRENRNHTLQTTALVNEAYIKLIDQRSKWQNRAHFFAIASRIMRRILLDHARALQRVKRGGSIVLVPVSETSPEVYEPSADLLDLDEALGRLADFDSQKARIVEMRFFGGLTIDEIAAVLKIAPVTVARHWSISRAWLQREMER
jgi:RNA polymerase sigma factor (TIGR02999 family)